MSVSPTIAAVRKVTQSFYSMQQISVSEMIHTNYCTQHMYVRLVTIIAES